MPALSDLLVTRRSASSCLEFGVAGNLTKVLVLPVPVFSVCFGCRHPYGPCFWWFWCVDFTGELSKLGMTQKEHE